MVVTDAYRKLLHRFASNPNVLRMMMKTAPAMDRFAHRLTNGRYTFSGRIMPIAVVTTTGSRSGLPRETPLLCITHGNDFLVIGSNFGQTHHPAWSMNLIKKPEGVVSIGGRRIPVTATLLDGPERDEAWHVLLTEWPPFEKYLATADGRKFRIFRLTPKA